MTEQVETATDRRTDQINLSDVAAGKVKSLLEQEGRDDLALRISCLLYTSPSPRDS